MLAILVPDAGLFADKQLAPVGTAPHLVWYWKCGSGGSVLRLAREEAASAGDVPLRARCRGGGIARAIR